MNLPKKLTFKPETEGYFASISWPGGSLPLRGAPEWATELVRRYNAHNALIAVLEEISGHLYQPADRERCRELANEALHKYDQ